MSDQQFSTVSLQLKKADAKKSKFTLSVIADDRVIEKKDRGAAEPLQFYTGRNRSSTKWLSLPSRRTR